MWKWTAWGASVLAALSAWALVASMTSLRRRRQRFMEVLAAWRDTPEERREAVVDTLLAQRPTCAAAWFLKGCLALREGRTREAARAFGMAHHADCNLENAAILTFACLKAAPGPESDIVEQIVETWEQLSRPDVRRRWDDRAMLEGLAADAPPPPTVTPLGRLVWLVVGPARRAALSRELSDPRHPWSEALGRVTSAR